MLYFKISYYLLAGVEEARLAVEGECDHGYQGSGTEQKKTRIKKKMGVKRAGLIFSVIGIFKKNSLIKWSKKR